MSITIMIENGREYVDANMPEAIETETFDCQCADFSDDGKPESGCWECKGTGTVSFTHYPFEVNLANANFRTTFSALGLPTDDCGTIAPHAILKAINRTPLALMTREDGQSPQSIGLVDCIKKKSEDDTSAGPKMFFCGISQDQAQSYQTRLAALAMEAERREENLYWC
jgi:hypothetical protein